MSSGGSVSSGMYSTATGFSTGPVPIEHASMVRGAHRVHLLCALQGTPAVCMTGYTRCVHDRVHPLCAWVHPLCALQGTPAVCMGTPAVCMGGIE